MVDRKRRGGLGWGDDGDGKKEVEGSLGFNFRSDFGLGGGGDGGGMLWWRRWWWLV